MEIANERIENIFALNEEEKTKILGKKIGFLKSVFGCQHRVLGRPMTINKISYRSCVECGARQYFDAESLERIEGFYMPPPEPIKVKIY